MKKNKKMRPRMESEDGFLSGMAEGAQEETGTSGPESWEPEDRETPEPDWQAQMRLLEARRDADIRDFLTVFPEAAKGPIPQEVWNAVTQGLSLTAAYVLYQRMAQQRMQAAARFAPGWNPGTAQNTLPVSAGFASGWNSGTAQNTLPVSAGFASGWNPGTAQNALPVSAGFASGWNPGTAQNPLPASTGSMRSAGYVYGPKDPFLDGLEGDW